MKKYLILFITIAAAISISCKSTPEEVEESSLSAQTSTTTTPASSTTTAPADTSGLTPDALQARTKALDFYANSYFPSEWEAIEALPASARTAAAYNEIFEKTRPLYAQRMEDEILLTREELIATGFTSYYPEYLKNADQKALAALDQYESQDYYAARDTATQALKEYETMLLGAKTYQKREELVGTGLNNYFQEHLDRADALAFTAADQYEAGNVSAASQTAENAFNEYDTLLTGAHIYLIRQSITDLGLEKHSQDSFNAADEFFRKGIAEYNAGDRTAAIKSAEEARNRYNVVLSEGMVFYAADKRTAASNERQLAIAERADIASREYFREADSHLAEAERLYTAGSYTDAASAFTYAEAMFAISRQDAVYKRHIAEERIREAQEVIESSSLSAMEAGRILEGGSR